MGSFKENLESYAELAVKVGVNIQSGQELVINAHIPAAGFVRMVAKKAYQAGAKEVHFRWIDDDLTLTRYTYAPDEVFQSYPEWEVEGLERLAERGAAFLDLRSPELDLLNAIDPERIAQNNKTVSKALESYRDYRMSDKVSWSILMIPSEAWAKKLFPDLEVNTAIQRLWEILFKMTRADREDPIQAWKDHQKTLDEKLNYLNAKKYHKLHYKAPGTDLMIEFPKGYQWAGGSADNIKGTSFFPNIPTEEVFTLPLKTGVNGTVTSTMPLNYSGTLIEKLSLTFQDGRIIESNAEKGSEILQHLVDTDEGSHYLGEVALVPNNSPIAQSGLIFFNTLYDENASCHLAIGKAYPKCLENGINMTREELDAHGVNKSLVHVDFMMGSAQLDIDGITASGEKEPVFRDGLWVF